MEKEAQLSMETLFSITIIMVIFLVILFFSITKRGELIDTERFIEKRKECSAIANSITQINLLGDGSETKIVTLSNVSIYNTSMLISVTGKRETGYCNIERMNIANYTNLTGNLTIKNINGRVDIQQA